MDAWLNRLRREIEHATSRLSEADWKRAPQGHWNSAQIVEHLGRTYGGTAKLLEQSLCTNQSASPGLRRATLKERVFQFLVVTLGQFPRGQKAPEFITPAHDAGPDALAKALGGLQRMSEALAAAERRWGPAAPVAIHFALGPMNAGQWTKFHYVHGHHHVKQIRGRSQPAQ
jgi:uncharacterized protein DUF1569